MLRYAAEDFYKIARALERLCASPILATIPTEQHKLYEAIELLDKHSEQLGLRLTTNQLAKVCDAIRSGTCTHRQLQELLEQLQDRVYEELETEVFRYIPKDKQHYLMTSWLLDSDIPACFPEAFKEFQRAGRCYAYDENTACVFHLMRIADAGLRAVASSLAIPYDAGSWHGIAKHITKKMEEKHDDKSSQWKAAEPFYAEILTDIQALSRGHRNKAIHELEKVYEGKEAHYLLTVIETFMIHLGKHGLR
jgi:hypothetical protein